MVFAQGVLFEHNPAAFCALLWFIGNMRKVVSHEQGKGRTGRPVENIRLSRTDLPDYMVRLLVAEILKLPPRPPAHIKREMLELQKVGNRLWHSVRFSASCDTHVRAMRR